MTTRNNNTRKEISVEFIVSEKRGSGFVEVTVKYKEAEVVFGTRVFSKVRPNGPYGVFYEFNEYLKTLDEPTKEKIFNCYKNIRELFDMDFEPSHIAGALNEEVKEIYKSVNMDKARHWLQTIGNVFIPADIESEITEESRYDKEDQTYLVDDYVDLTTGALMLRFMIPIFGEYMDQTTDQELYKETEAAALLQGSFLEFWPLGKYYNNDSNKERPAFIDKLRDYIIFCTSDKSTTLGNIWNGLAGIEIPIHLTAKVLVRRLTILSLNDHTSHSMVSNIFRYVKSNAEPTERTSAESVKDKYGGAVSEEDERKSFLEEYKTKQRISAGDIVAFNLDALDYELMATKVDSTIDPKKLQACIDCIEWVSQYPIESHQILLTQWIMAKAFPSRAFYHIDKKSVNYLVATAQALAWHWNFEDIAVFLQVEPIYQANLAGANQLTQSKMGTRIAGRYKQDLEEHFPHMRQGRLTNAGVRNNPENMAANAINTVSAALRSSDWIYKGPNELYVSSGQDSPNKVLVVPINNKHRLTELVIHLSNINK